MAKARRPGKSAESRNAASVWGKIDLKTFHFCKRSERFSRVDDVSAEIPLENGFCDDGSEDYGGLEG